MKNIGRAFKDTFKARRSRKGVFSLLGANGFLLKDEPLNYSVLFQSSQTGREMVGLTLKEYKPSASPSPK